MAPGVYAAPGSAGNRSDARGQRAIMQSAQPRDLGILVLVIGMFLVLFVASLTLGAPLR